MRLISRTRQKKNIGLMCVTVALFYFDKSLTIMFIYTTKEKLKLTGTNSIQFKTKEFS
jgi:hypothetical protein